MVKKIGCKTEAIVVSGRCAKLIRSKAELEKLARQKGGVDTFVPTNKRGWRHHRHIILHKGTSNFIVSHGSSSGSIPNKELPALVRTALKKKKLYQDLGKA